MQAQAVKGYLSNGWFTPNDGVVLPSHARVRLVIEEVLEKPQPSETLLFKPDDSAKQARIDGLEKIKAELELIDDEDLSDFPKQGLMKLPHEYAWFDV